MKSISKGEYIYIYIYFSLLLFYIIFAYMWVLGFWVSKRSGENVEDNLYCKFQVIKCNFLLLAFLTHTRYLPPICIFFSRFIFILVIIIRYFLKSKKNVVKNGCTKNNFCFLFLLLCRKNNFFNFKNRKNIKCIVICSVRNRLCGREGTGRYIL